MELKDKVVIVTGAGRGIGRELARTFAQAGATAACCARTMSQVQETVDLIKEAGGKALAIPVDVTDRTQTENLARTVLERYGRIDLLFNNAGSFKAVGPLWEVDPETWWGDVTVNVKGVMLCCRAVLPHMRQRNAGIIINMEGGGGANGPNVGGSGYGCSKAAVLRLTEGLARELEAAGSAVLAFCMNPGFVRTDMTEYLVATPERKQWQKHVPRLMGSEQEKPPDACARAALRLIGIAGPELNGRIFTVDTDFDEIAAHKQRIRDENLYVIKYATLKNRLNR